MQTIRVKVGTMKEAKLGSRMRINRLGSVLVEEVSSDDYGNQVWRVVNDIGQTFFIKY